MVATIIELIMTLPKTVDAGRSDAFSAAFTLMMLAVDALQHARHIASEGQAESERVQATEASVKDQHADQVYPPIANDVAQRCQRQQQRQGGDLALMTQIDWAVVAFKKARARDVGQPD
jgi:hypothetical protein